MCSPVRYKLMYNVCMYAYTHVRVMSIPTQNEC